MEIGSGIDRSNLLPSEADEAPSAWEAWLCGRTKAPVHIDAIRAVRANLAFELAGAVALLWTGFSARLHWRDAWDALDLLLALPTLFVLLSYHADPPPALARWCWVLIAFYAVGLALDFAWLFGGRWSAFPSRILAVLTDAGSLCMWMQCVFYNRKLAHALAQQYPVAYVTVSNDQVAARLP